MDANHICSKSIQLEFELQKARIIIDRLQKRCAEKAVQINRLKVAERRATLAKLNLEGIIKDIKERKWISDEGEQVLNVN